MGQGLPMSEHAFTQLRHHSMIWEWCSLKSRFISWVSGLLKSFLCLCWYVWQQLLNQELQLLA